MLDIQRDKFELRDHLRAEGLSDEEIKRQTTEELKPFKPAFINGVRVNQDPITVLDPTPVKKSRRTQRVPY